MKTTPAAMPPMSRMPTAAPARDAARLKQAILRQLRFRLAKDRTTASRTDYYQALVFALRDRLTEAWMHTQRQYHEQDAKRVYYLSAEFLLGRLLDTVLVNLDCQTACQQALQELGLNLDELVELEWDAGLGSGGLGRLAACFLDSMATLGIAGIGYGIRYEFGIFAQKIEDGFQVETPDNWLRYGNPWEICRQDHIFPVRFHGRVHACNDPQGAPRHEWVDADLVMALAYDLPIPGYRNGVVNTLRLWAAKSSREFDLTYFNHGDYFRAVEDKNRSENLSRVLYPKDDLLVGQELRLKQEYFLVSASLQDILRRYKRNHADLSHFASKVAIQLNDTHPALAIPELLRLLVDQEQVPWERAWDIVVHTFGYTNHTIMPEALERWPVHLLGKVLPRHLQIIYEMNHRFLGMVAERYPGDLDRLGRMSLIEEGPEKRVRMAHVAMLASHAVNGVSALHSTLLKTELLRDFTDLYPERFSNKTNGVSPRLWLKRVNPALAELLERRLGCAWLNDLESLRGLGPLAADADFRAAWQAVKQANKVRLVEHIRTATGLTVSPRSIFDCQIKRMHEYKRQLLNLLGLIAEYDRLKEGGGAGVPRTAIFAGKAAPGYLMAKLLIKLIHSVADVVNKDPATNEQLRIVFLPNYTVSQAEKVVPAADISQQISLAGTEASGTGNMKMALNGALTLGTPDGANLEIRDAVGADNIFLFGLTLDDVRRLRHTGYDPRTCYLNNPELRRALESIRDGRFSPGDRDLFRPIVDALLSGDRFLVLADFAAYVEAKARLTELYQHPDRWTEMSIRNVACMGHFSSDRTIREYASDIWGVAPAQP